MTLSIGSAEKLKKILLKVKQLTGLEGVGEFPENNNLLFTIGDDGQEYVLKYFCLYDGFNGIAPEKLKRAQELTSFIKETTNPHILKYVKEFQIDFLYFIQFERYPKTLLNLAGSLVANDQNQYVQYAIQLLETIEFLIQQGISSINLDLNVIYVDRNQQIKLFDFDFRDSNNDNNLFQSISKKLIKTANLNEQLPEVVEFHQILDNKLGQTHNQAQLIWQFGICMYQLAGASSIQIAKLVSGEESYIIQRAIGEELNQILLKILLQNPKSRPTISQLLKEFKLIKNRSNTCVTKEKAEFTSMSRLIDQKIEVYEYSEAIELLLRLSSRDERNDYYFALMGIIYIEINKFELSKEFSLKAIRINQNNDLALSNLGYIYYRENSLESSTEFLDKALQINPQNYRALTYKSYLCKKKLDYEGSLNFCNKAIQINPSYFHTQNSIAFTYFCMGLHHRAIFYYKRSVKLHSRNVNALNGLGTVYFELKQYQDAEAYYLEALKIEDELDYVHYNLGIIYYHQKEYLKAEKQQKYATQLNPTYTKAYYELGLINYKMKLYCQAELYLNYALKISPESEYIHLMMAKVYKKRNMIQKSEDSYRKVLTLNPENKIAIKNLEKMNSDCQIF